MNKNKRLITYAIALLVILSWTVALASAQTSRFQDKGNGVLLDTQTGLMWHQKDSYHDVRKGLNWYEALEYADQKNVAKFGGFNDWRLPTMKELQQIWDRARPTESKDGENIGLPKGFSNGGSYYVWTADERSLDNAWYFGLGQREEYFNLKDLGDLEQGALLVRSSK